MNRKGRPKNPKVSHHTIMMLGSEFNVDFFNFEEIFKCHNIYMKFSGCFILLEKHTKEKRRKSKSKNTSDESSSDSSSSSEGEKKSKKKSRKSKPSDLINE